MTSMGTAHSKQVKKTYCGYSGDEISCKSQCLVSSLSAKTYQFKEVVFGIKSGCWSGSFYTMQQVLGTASAVARRCHCAQQLQDVFSPLTADDEKGIISFLTEIFSGLAQYCARLCNVVQPSQVNKLQNKPAMYRI